MLPVRAIARPDKKSRIKWNPRDQVAARLAEIIEPAEQASNAMERGWFSEATRKLKNVKFLPEEAIDTQAKTKGAA